MHVAGLFQASVLMLGMSDRFQVEISCRPIGFEGGKALQSENGLVSGKLVPNMTGLLRASVEPLKEGHRRHFQS